MPKASHNSSDDEVVLKPLPYASGAEYGEYGLTRRALAPKTICSTGTRSEVLVTIRVWATTRCGAGHVFWLGGLASSGKTTIARTVASRCADARRLGASFFFRRGGDGGGDLAGTRKFVTTVGYQLAMRVPALKPQICDAARSLCEVSLVALP